MIINATGPTFNGNIGTDPAPLASAQRVLVEGTGEGGAVATAAQSIHGRSALRFNVPAQHVQISLGPMQDGLVATARCRSTVPFHIQAD